MLAAYYSTLRNDVLVEVEELHLAVLCYTDVRYFRTTALEQHFISCIGVSLTFGLGRIVKF